MIVWVPETNTVAGQGGTVPPEVRVTVQRVVFVSPSVKVTVPWGTVVPIMSDVTMAVKVTGWLTAEPAGDDVTVVAVPVAVTT